MAYTAVIKPVEGTILTVIREAAEAAQASAAQGADLTAVLEDTVFAARAAVHKTPDLLPTLKQAGVVDAGGQGLTYILEGIWRYSRGEPVEMTASRNAPSRTPSSIRARFRLRRSLATRWSSCCPARSWM